jgi:hypothetical protein
VCAPLRAQMDDSRYAVFAMACTYKRPDVEIFVSSLRRTGYAGHVQFGVDKDLDDDTRSFLEGNHVTMDTVPCETIPMVTRELRASHGLWLGGLNQARYTHYRRWLTERSFDRVWLLDTRDVVFMRSPFETEPKELGLFAEMPAMSVWVAQRISACFGDDPAKQVMAQLKYNLCGGTVYGTSAGITLFGNAVQGVGKYMSQTGAARRVCHVNDQPLINYLTWREGIHRAGAYDTPSLGKVQIHNLFDGPALTIKTIRVCGLFTDFLRRSHNNTRGLAVLHKWNKCPAARALAAARYPDLPVAKASIM